ncbi:MAG: hypothetical protein ABR562_05265, partial [Thermoplasmatota archaeon]
MSRPPLRILLVAEGEGTYLETLLALHGRFRVLREDDAGHGGHDAVLVAGSCAHRLDGIPCDDDEDVTPPPGSAASALTCSGPEG